MNVDLHTKCSVSLYKSSIMLPFWYQFSSWTKSRMNNQVHCWSHWAISVYVNGPTHVQLKWIKFRPPNASRLKTPFQFKLKLSLPQPCSALIWQRSIRNFQKSYAVDCKHYRMTRELRTNRSASTALQFFNASYLQHGSVNRQIEEWLYWSSSGAASLVLLEDPDENNIHRGI